LIERQIVAVVNFPKQMVSSWANVSYQSCGEQEDVVLLAPDFKIENGLRIG
jgi:tRNA-binding protein